MYLVNQMIYLMSQAVTQVLFDTNVGLNGIYIVIFQFACKYFISHELLI